jgi:hypothetical protein
MKSNSGIVLNNGNLNAKNLAVGDNASININSDSNQEKLIEKVNELLVTLENEKSSLSNFETLKQASETVQNEVKKDEPDKNIILTLLSLISSSVPAVSGVVSAIKAIKEVFE